jgi:uncharacterized protein
MRNAIMALLCLLVIGADVGAREPVGEPARPLPAGEDAPPGLVPMQVRSVLRVNAAPAVLLVDESQQRYLLVFVDFFMANAIRMGMDGPQLERPLTHDLIGILLRRLGAKVTRVTITGIKDQTYYALISVQVNGSGEIAQFDARPSDALAIAVRNGTPIFAAAELLKPIDQRPDGLPKPQEPAPADEPEHKGRT